jgi:hypothetical protein
LIEGLYSKHEIIQENNEAVHVVQFIVDVERSNGTES